jgi:restriction endonuclease S subunit
MFLYDLLKTTDLSSVITGAAQPQITRASLSPFKIPLPPVAIQEEIVNKIKQHERIITGAKLVVDNYKPQIEINPAWEVQTFENAPFEIIDGDRGVNYPNGSDFTPEGYCLFLNTKNVRANGFLFDELMFISKEKDELLRKGKLKREDVLLTTRGTVGNTAYYDKSVPYENIRINSGMLIFRPQTQLITGKYLYYYLQSENCQNEFKKIISGAAQPQLPIRSLNNAFIHLPSLTEQEVIVSKIEKELSLVNANKELITIYEQKIKDEINKLWAE